MTQHITKTSPRFLARMAGLFFLLTILGGIFAQGFVSERLIDFTNAAATATNILTHKSMFQLGFTVYLIEMACQVATAALFYVLLIPVSKCIAFTAALLGLVGSAATIFWLLVFGVNEQKWKDQSGAPTLTSNL